MVAAFKLESLAGIVGIRSQPQHRSKEAEALWNKCTFNIQD
jgi:hypothetical protein